MSSQTPEKDGSTRPHSSSMPTYEQIRRIQYLITKRSVPQERLSKHLVEPPQDMKDAVAAWQKAKAVGTPEALVEGCKAVVKANAVGAWEGVEEGMPLVWHFERLRDAGFGLPECFWRSDGDAIYGAIRV